jgi:predicted unusual protein kinase regulating ubiquinone biosynthesis (AarF/ABC1/UbiB family)
VEEMSDIRKRTWVTAKMAAKIGFAAAKKTLNIDSSLTPEKAVMQAIELVEQFDGMKGLLLKFGQMASYLNTGLPPAAQKILAKLQSSGTPMPYEQIQNQIESTFNQSVAELFDAFNPQAFAAASIGQVHRAVYQGREVAVKIQYPDIQQLIERDLNNVGKIAPLLFVGSSADGDALIEELQNRVLEECDYLLEAKRQAAIGAIWNKKEYSIVPEVILDRSNEKVLTTIFEPGLNFYTFCETANAESRAKSNLEIFTNVFEGVFRYGFFNGDPHPGNYLFTEDGKVIFLDFGCVRVFPEAFLVVWKESALSVLDQNFSRFKECSVALGFVGNVKKFDWDDYWGLINFIYEPFRVKEPFCYTREYVSESYRRIIWQNKNRFHGALPPEMLLVNRLQWGLFSVLADLNTEVIYRDIFREAVESKIERVEGLDLL